MRTLLTFIIFSTIFSFYTSAQVTVRDKPKESEVFRKPPEYDSLALTFYDYSKLEKYKYNQYIGHKVYFKPLTEKEREEFNLDQFIVDKTVTLKATPSKAPAPTSTPKKKSSLSLGPVSVPTGSKKKGGLSIPKIIPYSYETNLYKPIISKFEQTSGTGAYKSDYHCVISSDPNELENKTFTIENFYLGHDLNEKLPINHEKGEKLELILVELSDEEGNTFYWKTSSRYMKSFRHFMLLTNYEAHKSKYKGENFVFRRQLPSRYQSTKFTKYRDGYEDIILSSYIYSSQTPTFQDINTLEEIKMKDLSEWTCTDIAILPHKDSYNEYYILENEAGNEITIPLGYLLNSGFVFKENYEREVQMIKEKQELAQLQEEQRKELEKQREIERQRKIQERKETLIKKYGKEIGEDIINGRVRIGMTKEMCKEAWGNYSGISITGNLEIWMYGLRNALHFQGNKLVSVIVL